MVAKKRKAKQDRTEEAKLEIEQMISSADASEAYLIGLLWSNELNYAQYSDKINHNDFLHRKWSFFYYLGMRMFAEGTRKFDDITINIFVEKTKITDTFNKYGGLDTIEELVEIVKENELNIEYYYNVLLKNKLVMNLYNLYGAKVVLETDKYSYKDLNIEELSAYWQAKSSLASLNLSKNYTTENLYINGKEFLKQLEQKNEDLIPFYDSHYINNVVQGMPRGEVTVIGGFGNSGKSSFIVDKILMSMLSSEEKTLIVLNEEPAHSFRVRLLLSILNHKMREEKEDFTHFSRKKLLSPELLTETEKQLIIEAWDKLLELTDGDEKKIEVVYMEEYKISDLKDIIRLYATKGYVNLIIDTHKVPDQYTSHSRWEAFVEATKEIYKFTRAEAGGFNLRTVLSIQLADAYISHKFLSFDAIGEGKAMKNEASTVLMFRPLFADEYDKLKPYRFTKSQLSGRKDGWIKESVELDESKTYYVLFVPKNRQGANTDTGQDCILMQPNFDFNSFREIGYVKINRSF